MACFLFRWITYWFTFYLTGDSMVRPIPGKQSYSTGSAQLNSEEYLYLYKGAFWKCDKIWTLVLRDHTGKSIAACAADNLFLSIF